MEVHIACPCPGTPHPDGDTVTLREKPNLQMGMNVIALVGQGEQVATLSGHLAEAWLIEGIIAWSLVDDDGEPLLVSSDTVHGFCDDWTSSFPVAEAAAGLYQDAIFDPLLARVQSSPTSSNTGRTGASTSARASASRRRRPSP